MKLELKHLVPYLPYGLKIKVEHFTQHESNTFRLSPQILDDFIKGVYNIKPILRPLSDLTKEIEINGKFFIPAKWFGRVDVNLTNPLDNTYEIVRRLLEWHFDVFGLIEQGLAIDINQ